MAWYIARPNTPVTKRIARTGRHPDELFAKRIQVKKDRPQFWPGQYLETGRTRNTIEILNSDRQHQVDITRQQCGPCASVPTVWCGISTF